MDKILHNTIARLAAVDWRLGVIGERPKAEAASSDTEQEPFSF